MKSIAIVTDSNCGISPSQAKDLGIYMLPMPFFIDEKEYLEDIDTRPSSSSILSSTPNVTYPPRSPLLNP